MSGLQLELGALLLVIWIATLFLLRYMMDRGRIAGPIVIEAMMLFSIACLVSGISLIIKGAGLA